MASTETCPHCDLDVKGCVIAQESERMYPVAGGTVRMPKKDVVVGGKYVIPKNVTVFMPVSSALSLSSQVCKGLI